MKQFQFEYTGDPELKKEVAKIGKWCSSRITSHVVFRIFTELQDREQILLICDIFARVMPHSIYYGCSTNGNILSGTFKKSDITITCTIFEYPTTRLKLLQYPLTADNYRETTAALIREVEANPWVTAIEMLTTIRGMSMTGFCEEMGKVRTDVAVFGGGAFSEDMNDNDACVFSKAGGYSEKAVIFLLMGGPDFHVKTDYLTGWKPLGRVLLVTMASGSTLYELDGKPAYDTYYKYLRIKNDENFFLNTLEFPFIYKLNGISILRAPIASNEDGSLTMTSDISENVHARIAYGDPWTILDIIHEQASLLRKFQPEAISIFSCAARRTFWGDEEADRETKPFQEIAPTSGFYTSGEFLRTNNILNQHNVTLVITAMREGDLDESLPAAETARSYHLAGKVSMINRLATFIEAATEELEEANRRLRISAMTDGLTQLYNRIEIQRRITDCVGTFSQSHRDASAAGSDICLIMMDIDNFKKVNDTYGHNEGDAVLRGLSHMLTEVLEQNAPGASAGRWGGEEFMVLIPHGHLDQVISLAELLRQRFHEIPFSHAGHCTMSLGVTEYIPGENADIFCMRADTALYEAKNSGKNKVIARPK